MHFKPIGKITSVAVGLLGAGQLMAGSRPNIILIMTDQQTYDAMSFAGNKNLKTPAMDGLAADGVTFNRAYCSYPLSGPSRASLMTGKMPCEIGITDNEQALPENEISTTLGNVMSKAGYDCLYAGKWHIPTADVPETGFGFKKLNGMNDLTLVDNVRKELDQKHDKPVFLVASFLNPHEICEYARSQTMPYGETEIPKNVQLPALPSNFNATKGLPEGLVLHQQMVPKSYPTRNYSITDWRNYLYTYYRLVEKVDQQVGELIALLKQKGLYDNSLIIFTSDHGDGVGAHHWNQKRALFEETIRIPLIVKAPASEGQKAQKTDALVNIGLDVYPTVCDYASITPPASLTGKSLKSNLKNTTEKAHESVLVETFLDGIQLRGWCVMSGQYKYVLYQYFKDREQLFDLKKDWGETKNLVNDPQFAAVRAQMRALMEKYAKQLKDTKLLKELK